MTRRVGVVVLDYGRPDLASRAADSARHDGATVLIVENGMRESRDDGSRLSLAENRGFAGGMNAGIDRLLAEGCDRILLLNNDAVLEESCLARLAAPLDDASVGASGPVILRSCDGRIESRGIRLGWATGRVTLIGHGEPAPRGGGVADVDALSGAVLMLGAAALRRVGPLDESFFHSFEDVDWCLRARDAGLRLVVVLDARARHSGGTTLGIGSPDRHYYATRNHRRVLDARRPLCHGVGWGRAVAVLLLNLAHAARSGTPGGCRAVIEGFRDGARGRGGPRPSRR